MVAYKDFTKKQKKELRRRKDIRMVFFKNQQPPAWFVKLKKGLAE